MLATFRLQGEMLLELSEITTILTGKPTGNSEKMRNIEYFDKQRGLINLLLFIEKNGRANISGIRNKGNINFGIAYKCLKIMDDMGLLMAEEEGFNNKISRGYKAKHYHLTEKGKKVAAVFNEIDDGYNRSRKIEQFDNQTGLIKLVLFLFKNNKAYVTEIQKRGKINTASECLYLLDNWGFIETKQEYSAKSNRRLKTNHYSLTEDGKEVAKKLSAIENIVEN